MANQEDCLDRVWIKVINVDPKGSWIEECLEKTDGTRKGPFAQVAAALRCILAQKPSRLDLGQIARFERYEAVYKTLDALDHPGLAKGKIKGLHRQLEASAQAGRKARLSESEFIHCVRGFINPADDGTSLQSLLQSIAPDAAFGDVPSALGRLLNKSIKLGDLGTMLSWHRYEAAYHSLRLLEEEGFREAAEIPGIHEILLGLDPSGKEGKPGSWPLFK
jgi:hypothetical protein